MKRTVLAVVAMSAVLALATPAAAQYVGPKTIGLSAVAGQCPGDTVTVTGSEFTPGGDVTILFDGDVVGVTQADAAGDFSVTIEVPAAAAGEHVVVAIDETSGKSVSTLFTCVGAAAGLAVTGGSFKVWMLLLGGLILVGAVALLAGRRRARDA